MIDAEIKSVLHKEAVELNVSAAALLAVVETCSKGKLLSKGKRNAEPFIRFEGHYFDRYLAEDQRLEARAAGLSHPLAGEIINPRSQAGRWKMLHRAIKINRQAALSAVAWGIGDVMGAHWKWLGYGSVDALVSEVREGVRGEIAVLIRYIKKAGLVHALQERDWMAFAQTYKGWEADTADFAKRLESAFDRFSAIEDTGAHGLKLPNSAVAREDTRLMFGSRGRPVKDMQAALTRKGYVVVRDGLFGLVCDRVVRQFQRDHLLKQTGIIDRAERVLLFENIGIGSLVRSALRLVGEANLMMWLRNIRSVSGRKIGRLLSILNRFA